MSGFKAVARVSDLEPGQKKGVRVGLSQLLLVNVEGSFYAVGSRCPHMHLSLIKGPLEGNVITCPHHGSQFDVKTGEVLKGPSHKPLSTHEVKIEGEDIFVGRENS